jgi:hypothetical protein
MNARTFPVAVILGLVLALCASSGQLNPMTSAQSQVVLDLPLRTWVPRPLPAVGGGAMPAGRSGKHARWIFDVKRRRMVIAGGDWLPMRTLSTDPYFYDGPNTVWALGVANWNMGRTFAVAPRAGRNTSGPP